MLKKVFSMAALAVAACFLLASCGKDKNDGPTAKEYTLEISPSSTDTISSSGGEITVTVNATGDWVANSSDVKIASCDPKRGSSSEKSFKVVFTSNTDTKADRTVKITVAIDISGVSVSKEITFVQSKLKAAFKGNLKGKFNEICKWVNMPWDRSSAVRIQYEVIAKGTLKLSFTNQRWHVFLYDGEPGYFDSETATNPVVPQVNLYWGLNSTADAPGTRGDYEPDAWGENPREIKQGRSIDDPYILEIKDLSPGTYWTVHTTQPLPALDTDNFDLTWEFIPD